MPVTVAHFEERMAKIRSEHRTLVQELEHLLDKLSMQYARDARRKSGQLAKQLELGAEAMAAPQDPKSRKQALRRRVAGIHLHRGADPGPPPGDDE